MTSENRRKNIALEQERWQAALRSAELLASHGEYADSVSRAYYAMLHAARAVLLLDGLETKTHLGVSQLFNLHFVREGRVPPDVARLLTRLQAEREAADYDRAAVFTEKAATEALQWANAFCDQCLRTLSEATD
ncbi:MAG: HEPN domain-containing protein [Vulcanimicrobiota bacterium]